ncbi:HAMP domain-containing histidine kinase [bacterium]|nr:HAMP domain-containing histidine kinase [bacterium]
MSIKLKFSLLVSILNILIISLVSFFILRAERKLVAEDIQDKQITLLNGFIQVCKDSYVNEEELGLFNYVKVIKNTPAIQYLLYIDKGKIKVCDNPVLIGKEIENQDFFAIKKKGVIVFRSYFQNKKIIQELSSNISVKDKNIGTAIIGFSDEVLRKLISESFVKSKKIIVLISMLGIFLGILGAIFLSNMIIAPIKILATNTKWIGEGKLDRKIEIKSNDEIGQLASAFNQMTQKLKELDRMKQDFTSSVTHDLKSPLNIIRNCINYVLKKKKENRDKTEIELLLTAQNNVDRLSKYITTLLDVAKIESAKSELFKEQFNILTLIKEVIEFFSFSAKEKNVIMRIQNVKEEFFVNADLQKIRQLIMNLVSNALKYTEKGEICIEVSKQITGIQVSVSDTGCGIPQKYLTKIFDKFYRVQRENINRIDGTGLGLSICNSIIEAHKGKIWVKSKINQGSSFLFFIPNS